jgi:nitrogenase subunit NifH
VKNENSKVEELAQDFETEIVAEIPWSEKIQEADEKRITLMQYDASGEEARAFMGLADIL